MTLNGEEYRKESDGRSYLLLKKEKDTFEEQMIQRARPAGVLPMVRSEREGYYKYEITAQKNLAMTFERVPMTAEQVEKVLQGILDVLGGGREFLLVEDNYILSPEYIYLRIPEYEVMLCYYPGYEVPFAEQLGKLFEVLLNRVDYREERAISLVYALYMRLQEPDMTLERIGEKLREQMKNKEQPLCRQEEQLQEMPKELWRKSVTEQTFGADNTGVESKKNVQRKAGLWERLRKEVGGIRFSRGERQEIQIVPSPVPCVRDAEPDWGSKYTKVLSVKKTESGPALISQRNGETVFLTKFPFYVGSLPEYMDFVMERDTVSRFHAKFIRRENEVLLSDLNSTNGTKVNGRMLNVQEQVPLVNGDRIIFADEEFVFFEKRGS